MTRDVVGRPVPGGFGASLSCPLSSEMGTGALVQPQGSPRGALGEVPQDTRGLRFWGGEWCWVTGELVPRGLGSCVGWPC